MQGDEQNAFPAMPLSDYIDQFFGGFEQVGTDGSTKKKRITVVVGHMTVDT